MPVGVIRSHKAQPKKPNVIWLNLHNFYQIPMLCFSYLCPEDACKASQKKKKQF